MGRMSVEEFHTADKLPFIVVLDNVRSQHNVGAVFRTADAMLLEGVYLCGICCCPPNQEIHKTALGAEESVDWTYFADTKEAIRVLKEKGYKIVSDPAKAETIVVNTCGFILPAKEESIETIFDMAEYKKTGKLNA